MALQLDSQHLTIDNCKGIVITDIEVDEVNGFARRIQFYVDLASVENRRPVLEIMLYDDSEANLMVHTPELMF